MSRFPLDDDLPQWWLAGRRRRGIEFCVISFVLLLYELLTGRDDPLFVWVAIGVAIWILYRIAYYIVSRIVSIRGSVGSQR